MEHEGRSLIRDQYAAVGAAAIAGLDVASVALEATRARGVDVGALADSTSKRLEDALLYRSAYNRYVAPFAGIDDLRIAPFHLLASEGLVHDDKDHMWHMTQAHRLAGADATLILATRHRRIDLADSAQVADAIGWWEELTAAGGEGRGGQAAQLCGAGRQGPTPAGDQMSRARVSAHHLRTGLRPAGKSRAAQETGARSETIDGPAGVRPGA